MKKGRKKKGFFQRGIAVLLCCIWMLAIVPANAMALEEAVSTILTDEQGEEKGTKENESTEIEMKEEKEDTVDEKTSRTASENQPKEQGMEKMSETEAAAKVETLEEQPKKPETEAAAEVETLEEQPKKLEIAPEEEISKNQSKKSETKETLEGQASADTQMARASFGTYNISHQLSHVDMVYCHYEGKSDAATAEFKPVKNGDTQTVRSNENGYYVYFLRPEPGYLLTEFRGYQGRSLDLYAVDAANVYIDGYESISTVLGRAKDLGYIGYFGYRCSAMTQNVNVTHVVSAEKPEMSVTATANPNTNIVPGDMVTFTIKIEPGHTGVGMDKITAIQVTSIKINGNAYPMSQVTDYGDGTYRLEYEVSYEDWMNKSAKLDVTASIHYENTIELTDTHSNTSKIKTTTVVDGSATANCEFAEYLMQNLRLIKRVSGNMYDENKAFTFTIQADEEMICGSQRGRTIRVDLKKDDQVNVIAPAGVRITIFEDPDGYEYSFDDDNSTITSYRNVEQGITFIMPQESTTVTFCNERNVPVDTGVTLDAGLYTTLLTGCVICLGMTLKKHKRSEYR